MYSEDDIKLIKKANKRIKRILFKYEKDSWATKKLKSRLNKFDNITELGYIRTNRNVSDIEKKATLKAINRFLASETSTLRGIRKQEKKIKKSLKSLVEDYNPTREEVQNLYEYFEDKDFKDLSKYIPPSDLHILIIDTQHSGLNNRDKKKRFVEQIKTYAEFGNDFEINKTINRLYNKIK